MRGWILSAVSVAVVVALLRGLPGKGSIRRIVAMAGGVLLLITLLEPLCALDVEELLEEGRLLIADAGEEGKALTGETEKLMETLIAEECETYIQQEAEGLGISCQVEVVCDAADGEMPMPEKVIVYTDAEGEALLPLARLIEADLGVAKENQSYRKG